MRTFKLHIHNHLIEMHVLQFRFQCHVHPTGAGSFPFCAWAGWIVSKWEAHRRISVTPASVSLVAAVSVTAAGWRWRARWWPGRTRRWTPLRKYISVVSQSVSGPASRWWSRRFPSAASGTIWCSLGWNSFPTWLFNLKTANTEKNKFWKR